MTKGISSAARKTRKLKQPWASMSQGEWAQYFERADSELAKLIGHPLTVDEQAEFRSFLDSYLRKNGLLGENPRAQATIYNACGDWFKHPELAPDAVGKPRVRDPKAKAAAGAAKAQKGAR